MFGVGGRRVKKIVSLLRGGALGFENKRGKLSHNIKYNLYKNQIKKNKDKYETLKSHYNRGAEKCDRKYLPTHLNLKIMHRNFVETNTTVSYYLYRKVFLNEFNIKFKPPSIDVCDRCFAHQNMLKTEVPNKFSRIKTEHEAHINNANEFYTLLKNDYGDTSCKISFDMQQLLPLPFSRTNKTYYSRQLWLHCVGVVRFQTTDQPSFYLWNETEGK